MTTTGTIVNVKQIITNYCHVLRTLFFTNCFVLNAGKSGYDKL